MNLNQFLANHIDVINANIMKNLGNQFDSHDFIRLFAKTFEIEYIKFLSIYNKEPFRKTHAIIALFLSTNRDELNIQPAGKVLSKNIFGDESENECWIKII